MASSLGNTKAQLHSALESFRAAEGAAAASRRELALDELDSFATAVGAISVQAQAVQAKLREAAELAVGTGRSIVGLRERVEGQYGRIDEAAPVFQAVQTNTASGAGLVREALTGANPALAHNKQMLTSAGMLEQIGNNLPSDATSLRAALFAIIEALDQVGTVMNVTVRDIDSATLGAEQVGTLTQSEVGAALTRTTEATGVVDNHLASVPEYTGLFEVGSNVIQEM